MSATLALEHTAISAQVFQQAGSFLPTVTVSRIASGGTPRRPPSRNAISSRSACIRSKPSYIDEPEERSGSVAGPALTTSTHEKPECRPGQLHPFVRPRQSRMCSFSFYGSYFPCQWWRIVLPPNRRITLPSSATVCSKSAFNSLALAAGVSVTFSVCLYRLPLKS